MAVTKASKFRKDISSIHSKVAKAIIDNIGHIMEWTKGDPKPKNVVGISLEGDNPICLTDGELIDTYVEGISLDSKELFTESSIDYQIEDLDIEILLQVLEKLEGIKKERALGWIYEEEK